MPFKTTYRSGEREAEIMQTCWAYGIKIVRHPLDNYSVVIRVIKNINNQEYVTSGKVIYSQKIQANEIISKGIQECISVSCMQVGRCYTYF